MYFINERSQDGVVVTDQIFSVSDFLGVLNQTFEMAFPVVYVEGEVSGFKVNQGKWVFFDLKDESGTVNCFMSVYQLRVPLEDGMRVVVAANPKVTAWGKFSLTVQQIRLSGEGSIKKGFELLKAKLDKEGLFAPERKRMLPELPRRVGVITSTQAAGYADFVKILNSRWGGLDVQVAHTQVQGDAAPDQMIRALRYFNEQAEPVDVIVLIRGGGSADDLAGYNDEKLVREIAASRIPTLVGVGHEVDTSLADMVADVRAATPSNAAQLLVPDKREIIASARERVRTMASVAERSITMVLAETRDWLGDALALTSERIERMQEANRRQLQALRAYDPRAVLRRGYALVRGEVTIGGPLEIETNTALITAEVTHVSKK